MTPPRVVVVTLTPRGGAGAAARRSQLALREAGVPARLLARRDPPEGPDVVPLAVGQIRNSRRVPAGELPEARWTRLLAHYPGRAPGIEMFTDPFGDVALEALDAVREADVVHLHWVAGLADIPSLPQALAGKRVFWTMHDMNPFTGGCHYSLGCRRFETECGRCPLLGSDTDLDITRSFAHQKKRAYRQLDLHMVSPSRWLAEVARLSPLLSGIPVSVVPNSVPTDIFTPYPPGPVRQALGIPQEAPLLVFGAGYDVPRKGFDHLMRALALLPGFHPHPFHLAVFGVLPSLPLGFPAERLHNLGRIDRPEHLAAVLSAGDCFVIPSVEDNLPNVVLEALACGLPVVGFSIGGLPDLVDHQKTGYLAVAGDDEDLARGLAWVLGHPERQAMATLCRFRVLKEFSPQHHAARLLNLYGSTGR